MIRSFRLDKIFWLCVCIVSFDCVVLARADECSDLLFKRFAHYVTPGEAVHAFDVMVQYAMHNAKGDITAEDHDNFLKIISYALKNDIFKEGSSTTQSHYDLDLSLFNGLEVHTDVRSCLHSMKKCLKQMKLDLQSPVDQNKIDFTTCIFSCNARCLARVCQDVQKSEKLRVLIYQRSRSLIYEVAHFVYDQCALWYSGASEIDENTTSYDMPAVPCYDNENGQIDSCRTVVDELGCTIYENTQLLLNELGNTLCDQMYHWDNGCCDTIVDALGCTIYENTQLLLNELGNTLCDQIYHWDNGCCDTLVDVLSCTIYESTQTLIHEISHALCDQMHYCGDRNCETIVDSIDYKLQEYTQTLIHELGQMLSEQVRPNDEVNCEAVLQMFGQTLYENIQMLVGQLEQKFCDRMSDFENLVNTHCINNEEDENNNDEEKWQTLTEILARIESVGQCNKQLIESLFTMISIETNSN